MGGQGQDELEVFPGSRWAKVQLWQGKQLVWALKVTGSETQATTTSWREDAGEGVGA